MTVRRRSIPAWKASRPSGTAFQAGGQREAQGPSIPQRLGWIVKFSLGVDIVNDIKRLFLEFQSAGVSFHQTLKRELDHERKRNEELLTRLKYLQADVENTRKRVEKINAMNIAARCSLIRFARIKKRPITKAMAERPFSRAFSAGKKRSWVPATSAGA